MPMIIVVDLTGDRGTTIYDAARWLVAAGTDPSHTLETRRGGYLSMSGKLCELVDWTVKFRASGPYLVPYQGRPPAPLAAKSRPAVIVVPEVAGPSPTAAYGAPEQEALL
jgi:hypothetical protein